MLFSVLLSPFCKGQGVQVEVYAGLSFANLNGTEEASSTISFGSRSTFPFGLNLDLALSENILFGTGIGYSPRGTTVEVVSGGYSLYPGIDLTVIQMNYIDIPALLVIAPSSFRVFIGPQLSFLTSAEVDGYDISGSLETNSFGIRYGIGFDSNSFAFRISGQNGFTDVYKHPDEEWTTHAYTFSVGYILVKRREGSGGGKSRRKDDFVPAHRKIDF